MTKARAQVHFHDNNTASCIVSVPASGEEGMGDQLLLWACFANRQLVNMGSDAPPLASFLSKVPGSLDQIVDADGKGPKLLSGHPGNARRRFEAQIIPTGKGRRFILKMKGFGIFGKRLDYYWPTSVVLLLRHLARLGKNNPDYVAALAALAQVTGQAFLAGEVNMRNGAQRAWLHVVAALSETQTSRGGPLAEAVSEEGASEETLDATELDSLASSLTEAFAEIREFFYRSCVENARWLGFSPRPKPVLTSDGRFLVTSFQIWLMANIIDLKREAYIGPEAVQEFADQMYIKGLAPYRPGDASSTSVFVELFTEISREDDASPYEIFFDHMREVLFTGSCRTDGYRTPMVAMGVAGGPEDLFALRAFHSSMVQYLTLSTQLAVAEAFGDEDLAREQANALEELMADIDRERKERKGR